MRRSVLAGVMSCLVGCGSRGADAPNVAVHDGPMASDAAVADTSTPAREGGKDSIDAGSGVDAGGGVKVDAGGADLPVDGRPDSGTPGTSAALRAFFTDLVSGPNGGGENGKGAFVTVHGRGFGAVRGGSTVTIGGGAADNYPVWSDGKITFQLGAAAASGEVVVHVPGLGTSNGLPFRVRAGNIRCVEPQGSDGAAGLWGSCWRTVPGAVHNAALASGDIIYLLAGVTATAEDPMAPYSCAVCITQHGGSADAPTALVGYPGAIVTLGTVAGQRAIRVPNIAVSADHWTIANLHLQGISAIGVGGNPGTTGWRVVGNDLYCPNGNSGTSDDACFEGDRVNGMKFYGNDVHDVSANTNPSKLYHAVYWSTDSNHIDAGWNRIGPSNACRGIQFHSSPSLGNDGFNQYDLHVHDNVIHDIRCDGINFATVDPSKGPVEAYNNVIYRAGAGPLPLDGGAEFNCIYNAGITNKGAPGSGRIEIYNNTFHDCGASGGGVVGSNAPVMVNLRNNLAVVLAGQRYLSPDTRPAALGGDHNLWWGAGPGPASLDGNVDADPLFLDVAVHDFRVRAGSPTADRGTATPAAWDLDGVPRPQGSSFDLGAFER